MLDKPTGIGNSFHLVNPLTGVVEVPCWRSFSGPVLFSLWPFRVGLCTLHDGLGRESCKVELPHNTQKGFLLACKGDILLPDILVGLFWSPESGSQSLHSLSSFHILPREQQPQSTCIKENVIFPGTPASDNCICLATWGDTINIYFCAVKSADESQGKMEKSAHHPSFNTAAC